MTPLLVILDLDETLVHAADAPLDARAPDFRVDKYALYKRPGVDAFLGALLARHRVAVWTASSRPYATEVVARLVPDAAELAFFWCSERCTDRFDHETRSRTTIKKVRKVRYLHDLERVVVIDDSPEKHHLNYGNLVAVAPFEGDPADDELPRVLAYVDWLATQPSVRAIDKRAWRAHASLAR